MDFILRQPVSDYGQAHSNKANITQVTPSMDVPKTKEAVKEKAETLHKSKTYSNTIKLGEVS